MVWELAKRGGGAYIINLAFDSFWRCSVRNWKQISAVLFDGSNWPANAPSADVIRFFFFNPPLSFRFLNDQARTNFTRVGGVVKKKKKRRPQQRLERGASDLVNLSMRIEKRVIDKGSILRVLYVTANLRFFLLFLFLLCAKEIFASRPLRLYVDITQSEGPNYSQVIWCSFQIMGPYWRVNVS